MPDMHLSLFLEHRSHCFGLAYRMLGSKAEAEDILQETYERWHKQDLPTIENPQAFLTTIVSRLCIDQLRTHQQRENYIGSWLPEPLYDEEITQIDPCEIHSTAQSLSLAFLLLLEQLTPVERAVFLLKETFDYSYHEISEVVGKAPENCRQLCSRAKKRLNDNKKTTTLPVTNKEQHQQLLMAFLSCFGQPDMTQFHQILTDDISLLSDGGGKVRSVLRPLQGIERIVRFFNAIKNRMENKTIEMKMLLVNGCPSVLLTLGGIERSVFTLECRDGKIHRILVIRNPDKLPGENSVPAIVT